LRAYRIRAAIAGLLGIMIMGGMGLWWLVQNCGSPYEPDCLFLWGTGIASVLGGVLLIQILDARGKLHAPGQTIGVPEVSNSQVWWLAVVKVTLASVLAGLPFLAKGAFILAVSGTLTGVFLNGLIRAITNRLPPVK
jgi:hypothetical protein